MASLLNMSGGSLLSKGGLLPSGYRQLEYLEGTGTQWIDTGLKITSNYVKISAKITPLSYNASDYSRPWGVLGSSNLCFTAWDNGTSCNHPDGWLALGSNWYVGKSSTTYFNTTINTPYEFSFTADNGSISGNYARESFTSTYGGTVVNSSNVRLFDCGAKTSSRKAIQRVHYYKLETENASIDLIPAKRNSDSVVGMYDTVTNTFFTNAGTGDFIAGPEV